MDAERQAIVYSMDIDAPKDVAMVLPLPVKPGTGEKDVLFINLKEYESFFENLEIGFRGPPAPLELSAGMARAASAPRLVVVQVGSFEASFVPTVNDFSRLDERFRLPKETWDKLPGLNQSGFAVFKLKRGEGTIHPMAFTFPRANPGELFFPTIHIHDGKVHDKARFDHILYCQRTPQENGFMKWAESKLPAAKFMDADKAKGLIVKDDHCYRAEIRGVFLNRDYIVKTRG